MVGFYGPQIFLSLSGEFLGPANFFKPLGWSLGSAKKILSSRVGFYGPHIFLVLLHGFLGPAKKITL